MFLFGMGNPNLHKLWHCKAEKYQENKIELMQLSEDGPQMKFVKSLKIW